MRSSTHKKLVLAGIGCGGLLMLLAFGVLIFSPKLGIERQPGPRQYTVQQAAAALDSLGRLDVPALAALPPFDERLLPPARPRFTVVWRDTNPPPAVPFGDTFPATALQREIWLEAGQAVEVRERTPKLPPPKSLAPPRQPLVQGRLLLAATRRMADRRDFAAAVPLRAALLLARDLERRTDLSRQRLGARIERDALTMMSRDPALVERPLAARAGERLAQLEPALVRLRALARLIEAAGAGPAGAATLAAWAGDGALPLAVRDELLRAVGYGWVYNPMEVAYGVGAARRAALDGLDRAALPEALVPTLEAIQAMGKPGMTRRMMFSVQYRLEREE